MKKMLLILICFILCGLFACTQGNKIIITIVDGEEKVSYDYDETFDLQSHIPKKDGYIFKGFYLNDEKIEEIINPNKNIILTCQWEKVKYVVTFNNEGDKTPISTDNKVMELKLVKKGYKFLGWYLNDNLFDFNTTITSDIELNAKWEICTYTYEFVDYDGTVLKSGTYQYKDAIEAPNNPERKSNEDYQYTFINWDKNFSNVTENITIKAVYEEKALVKHKVSFMIDDIENEVKNVVEGKTIGLLPASKDATSEFTYEFIGWSETGSSDNLFDFTTPITKDITLKAVFKEVKIVKLYQVKFMIDENMDKEVKVEEGKQAISYDAIKDETKYFSYEFIGWSETNNKDSLFDFSKPITSDVTLYAMFSEIKLQQSFRIYFYNEKNEQGYMSVVSRGETVDFYDLKKADGNRYTYTIEAWYTDSARTIKYDFSTPVYSEFSLYAKYNKTEKPLENYVLEGKKISILGDSISTFYSENSEMNSFYSGEDQFYFPRYSTSVKTVDKTWWYMLINELKLNLGINNSLSGSSCNSGDIINRINTLDDNGSPDIIITFLGTNDNVNGYTTQFEGAYTKMLQTISLKYPEAYVFCVTLGYSAYKGYNYTESNRLAFNEQIRSLAGSYNAGIIDFAAVQTDTTYTKFLGDNLHPNSTGMVAYYQKAVEDIKAYFKK